MVQITLNHLANLFPVWFQASSSSTLSFISNESWKSNSQNSSQMLLKNESFPKSYQKHSSFLSSPS